MRSIVKDRKGVIFLYSYLQFLRGRLELRLLGRVQHLEQPTDLSVLDLSDIYNQVGVAKVLHVCLHRCHMAVCSMSRRVHGVDARGLLMVAIQTETLTLTVLSRCMVLPLSSAASCSC